MAISALPSHSVSPCRGRWCKLSHRPDILPGTTGLRFFQPPHSKSWASSPSPRAAFARSTYRHKQVETRRQAHTIRTAGVKSVNCERKLPSNGLPNTPAAFCSTQNTRTLSISLGSYTHTLLSGVAAFGGGLSVWQTAGTAKWCKLYFCFKMVPLHCLPLCFLLCERRLSHSDANCWTNLQ